MPRTQEHVLTHTPRIPIMYIPAGGTSIRDSRTVELLRDTFMSQLSAETCYCSCHRWIGAASTFGPVGQENCKKQMTMLVACAY